MSGGHEPFKLREEDVMKLLYCQTHVGASNVDHQMDQYCWKVRNDGTYIIHLKRTWEKVLLAARAIAAIENPADVCVISARPYAQRAILKFAAHTGATPIFGRFTPGCFTNQIQKAFKEPRLLIISDPRVDHQAVTEASYVNIPVISFCNTDSPLKLIDICIPCNNKGQQSIGLMWWLLAREVLFIKGKITRQTGFVLEDKEIMPDLYFYRDPEEAEKEELADVRGEETTKDDRWGQAIAPDAGLRDEAPSKADAGKLPMPFEVPKISDWATETQQWTAGQATQGEQPAAGDWGGASRPSGW